MPTRRDWPTYASRSVRRSRRYSSYELTQSLRRGYRGTCRKIGNAQSTASALASRARGATRCQASGAEDSRLPQPAVSDVELQGLARLLSASPQWTATSHGAERAFFRRTARKCQPALATLIAPPCERRSSTGFRLGWKGPRITGLPSRIRICGGADRVASTGGGVPAGRRDHRVARRRAPCAGVTSGAGAGGEGPVV